MRDNLLRLTAYAGCAASIIIAILVGKDAVFQRSAEWVSQEAQSAAVFFVTSITSAQIQGDYRGGQITDL